LWQAYKCVNTKLGFIIHPVVLKGIP
jgi:hypothetical protein